MLGACSDKPNDMIISQGKMEDVLFDYHIANGVISVCNYDSIKAAECINSVFMKHGIDREVFDSSMVYYLRHADKMDMIYANLQSRIENEGRLQGVIGGGDLGMASTDLNADTANIWNLERTKILNPEVPYNVLSFDFKADSTFKAGDRFMLKFKADFIYQEGMRNGYAILTMILNNDSVVNQTTSLSSTTERTMEVCDKERIGVKEVKGYLMHRPSNVSTDRNSSTVKMMILSNIQLIRMHTEEPKIKEEEKRDSINNDNNEKADSIKHNGPSVLQPAK